MADQTYDVVQLVGTGTVVNTTRILPTGGRWTLTANDSCWIPIPTDICEFRQSTQLCPEQKGNPEFTATCPIMAIPIHTNMWYMGKGRLWWEDL